MTPEQLAKIQSDWLKNPVGLELVADLWEMQPDGSARLDPPLNPDGTPDYETRDAMLKLLAESQPAHPPATDDDDEPQAPA